MRRVMERFRTATPWPSWKEHYHLTNENGTDFYRVSIEQDIPWFWPVVSGSRPHMPPISFGGQPTRFAKSAAGLGYAPYRAALTIALHGTPAHDFIRPIWEQEQVFVYGEMDRAVHNWLINAEEFLGAE
jgi:hypothetical protein